MVVVCRHPNMSRTEARVDRRDGGSHIGREAPWRPVWAMIVRPGGLGTFPGLISYFLPPPPGIRLQPTRHDGQDFAVTRGVPPPLLFVFCFPSNPDNG